MIKVPSVIDSRRQWSGRLLQGEREPFNKTCESPLKKRSSDSQGRALPALAFCSFLPLRAASLTPRSSITLFIKTFVVKEGKCSGALSWGQGSPCCTVRGCVRNSTLVRQASRYRGHLNAVCVGGRGGKRGGWRGGRQGAETERERQRKE